MKIYYYNRPQMLLKIHLQGPVLSWAEVIQPRIVSIAYWSETKRIKISGSSLCFWPITNENYAWIQSQGSLTPMVKTVALKWMTINLRESYRPNTEILVKQDSLFPFWREWHQMNTTLQYKWTDWHPSEGLLPHTPPGVFSSMSTAGMHWLYPQVLSVYREFY